MTQLSLFDVYEETVDTAIVKEVKAIYEEGNRVRILTAKELESPDLETIAYLTDYRYGGKVGTIKKVQIGSKGVSYEVETTIGTAYVSEGELAFIS